MSLTREVITIQVGHYSNFVGAHWWNLQEASFNYDPNFQTDIDHDFMFREGVTQNRLSTYTPRLLAIDAKGSLNNLASSGTLYEAARTPSPLEASWNGKVHVIEQIKSEKNEFLKDLEKDDARNLHCIDEDKDICVDDCDPQKYEESHSPQKIYNLKNHVNVWSDFLHTHLHPKTIYMLSDLWHQQAEGITDSIYWGYLPGKAIMRKETNEEEIVDRIRLLAESCGSLQGINLLTDSHNGMSGVASGVAQHLADEFSSKDTICFPIIPPHFSAQNIDVSSHYLTTLVQCYTELSNLTSLVVPLNMKQHAWSTWSPVTANPLLNIDNNCAYETSSVFAAFLDTISLCYRSRDSPLPINHLVQLMTVGGRKIASGTFAFPVGMTAESDLLSWLQNDGKLNLSTMTNGCEAHLSPITECQIVRGLNNKVLRSGANIHPSSKYKSVALLYEEYLAMKSVINTTRYVKDIRDPLKTGRTFPRIFSQHLDHQGFINSAESSSDVHSTPSIAGLHQGKSVGDTLLKISTAGSELNVSRLPRLLEEGIDVETWSETLENMRTLVGCYEIVSSSSECSDDD